MTANSRRRGHLPTPDGPRRLLLIRTVAVLALGATVVIIADGLTFAIAFGVTYGLQQAALYLLGRGAYRPILSIVFDLVRMSPNFLATLTLFTSRKPRFRVTPKGRMAADRGRIEAPVMLRAALAASFVGATVYVLHLLNVFSIDYASEWAAAGAFFWLVVNAALVWVAARRVRSMRFAAERRSAVRFAVDIPGTVDGATASVQDVSVGGALLATSEPLVERETHLVSFELPNGTTSIWARSARRVVPRAASITTRSSSSPGNTRRRARWHAPSSSGATRSPAPSASHGARCCAGRSARSRGASSCGPRHAPTARPIPSTRSAPPPRSLATPAERRPEPGAPRPGSGPPRAAHP